jgi:hypothetical protein
MVLMPGICTFSIGSAHGEEKRIPYYFYSQQEYDSTAEYINSKTKAIPGTMGLHAVVAKGDGNVMVRSTSCYCQGCVVAFSFRKKIFQLLFLENQC